LDQSKRYVLQSLPFESEACRGLRTEFAVVVGIAYVLRLACLLSQVMGGRIDELGSEMKCAGVKLHDLVEVR
jgi:hypothetical protein